MKLQKPIQKPKLNLKKNAYSVKMGDITIRAEGTQSLLSIRNRVLNDAFTLLEAKRNMMLNDDFDDDDEEDDQQEKLKERLKQKQDIMFQ